ncbi:MAG: 30S ribosomal protein S12 methylthiotransferase RimO [Roseburia sp.]|nr:30S ribosomal protein S12 methylthiotransferase RimO [Roseburia sp.]
MKNVAVISLGCDKNRVDTEHMLFSIAHGGYGICDVPDADVIIVNTCAFIESARRESIDAILSCAEYKKTGKCKKLVVTGCMPQKYRDELIKELPEVDAFLGAFEYDKILSAISDDASVAATECAGAERYDGFCAAENGKRLLTTYPHLAYIKIAEGCDNKCTFCTIPSIRGAYRSRPTADITDEAAKLARDGVREIVLVAQDVTRYGEDIGTSLTALLTELEKLPCDRIRLLYCYPERVTDELIEKIAGSDKIAKYIDIPVQHVSDRILKLMNRRTTGERIEALVNKLHSHGIAVRTTLMVGFPGETESDFEQLCAFVRRAKPEYAGIFAYSKETGTAAARLKDQIKKSVKAKRVRMLGAAAAEATREFNARHIGDTVKVLYEDVDFDADKFVGRADFQAPDVDGRVYFTSDVPVDVGNYYNVKITDSDDYDLFGAVEV